MTKAEPRDWAFTWTLIFTGVLFLRPQDLIPPLEALHLAELSAMAGLVALITGRLARRQTLTRMTPEFAGETWAKPGVATLYPCCAEC